MNFEKQRSLQQLRLLVRNTAELGENLVGIKASGWRFKPMRSQWGSCNSKNVIAINTRLMFLPDRLVSYVVFHEVLHLKFKNHGALFRRAIKTAFPDYLALNKQLHTYNPIIRN